MMAFRGSVTTQSNRALDTKRHKITESSCRKRKTALFATTALSTLLVAALPAYASCTVTPGGSVICGNTTTIFETNTNGGSTNSSARWQKWDNGVPIVATMLPGATLNGLGLELIEIGARAASITVTNPTGSTIANSDPNSTYALSLFGNGGLISYSGGGNIGGNNGIYASNAGQGSIDIASSGTISVSDLAIGAVTWGGDITINSTGDVWGGYHGAGISVQTSGTGRITINTASYVTGNTGIATASLDGDTLITNNGKIISTGPGGNFNSMGALLHSYGAGKITVTGSGDFIGGKHIGIFAILSGIGPGTGQDGIIISGAGNITTDGTGIVATIISGENNSNILINRSGSITTGEFGDGITIDMGGGGNITITGVGNIQAGNDGIYVGSQPGNPSGPIGNVLINPAGAVSGSHCGIFVSQRYTGAVTINTIGAIAGTQREGICAHAEDGAIDITIGAHSTVTSLGTDTGYYSIGRSGLGASASGSGSVRVNNLGSITAKGGVGLIAQSTTGAITILGGGTVTGTSDGIDVTSSGGGDILVNGVGNISANATRGIGIYAVASGGNGSITIAPAGTVSGGSGISASVLGTGDITVTTASGAAGNVTGLGTTGYGIWTSVQDGDSVVTNNAAQVSGTTWAVFAKSPGAGTITITGAGNYVGGSNGGIGAGFVDPASTTGRVSAGRDVIVISGSGNTSSVDGPAIIAFIDTSNNDGNIRITRSGTISTGAGHGIDAYTYGKGDVIIDGVGDITTTSSSGGIVAGAVSGNVRISPAGSVIGGISAFDYGEGSVSVTTVGTITGNTSDGIYTLAYHGATDVTINAGTTTGDGTGTAGVDSRAFGRGSIGVTVASGAMVTGQMGVELRHGGSGSITLNNSGTITGAGTTAHPVVWMEGGSTDTVINAGIIQSTNATANNRPADLAIYTPVDVGIFNIQNAGTLIGEIDLHHSTKSNLIANAGIWNVRDNTSTAIMAADLGTGGTNTLTNSGIINAGDPTASARSTFAGVQTVINSGTINAGLFGNGDVTTFTAGSGPLTVTNTGTINVRGLLAFLDSATFDNAGTINAGSSAGASITTFTGVQTLINSGTINAGLFGSSDVTTFDAGGTPLTVTNTGTINVRGHLVFVGSATFSNAGTLSFSDGTGSAAISGVSAITNTGNLNVHGTLAFDPGFSLTNAGTINAGSSTGASTTTFTGVQTLINSGTINAGLFGSGDVTTFDAGGSQTVTNTGSFKVHGLLAFQGNSTFNNTGGIIDMRTAGAATTDLVTLNMSVTGGGPAHASNTYAAGTAYDFNGGAGSRLGLDASLGATGSAGASVPSDRLLISGNATGSTGILINDTNTTYGGYNPIGITLVAVNGTSSNAFRLQSVSGLGDVLQPARGPLGSIKKGFWFYPLLQTPHAVAAADGLSSANSSEYRLYGLPDVEAFELPLAITGAQSIWYETALTWTKRQQELRDTFSGANTTSKPGLWLNITGSWTNRTMALNRFAVTPDDALPGLDTSYDQNIYAVELGVDHTWQVGENGRLVGGFSLGYVASNLSFKANDNTVDYTGLMLAGSAGYLNGPFFVDVLLKTDRLRLRHEFKSLTEFGYVPQDTSGNSWGILSNAGVHIPWTSGSAFIEPLLSVAYTDTSLDPFRVLGVSTEDRAGETVRGGIGGRIGGALGNVGEAVLHGAVTGRYWHAFTDRANLVLTSPVADLPLSDRGKGFGEVNAMLDIADNGSGWSGYLDGGAKLSAAFTIIEMSAGVRYQW